jgi:hypothetical protein
VRAVYSTEVQQLMKPECAGPNLVRRPWPRTGAHRSCSPRSGVKAALNGPLALPPGRAPAAAAVALRPSRLTPGGWRGEQEAPRAAAARQTVDRWCGGRQPAGPRGQHPARRRGAHVGRVGELAVVAGLRLLRLRRGRSGSRMAEGRRQQPGPWLVRAPSRLPSTRASRAIHHPTRQRPY